MAGKEPKESRRDLFDTALSLVREVGNKADRGTNLAKPYAEAEHPFTLLISDMYNAEQERRIYLGPPR